MSAESSERTRRNSITSSWSMTARPMRPRPARGRRRRSHRASGESRERRNDQDRFAPLARAREIEFVVLLDADGQHLPEEIGRFLAAATGHRRRHLFVGTRMNDVARMPSVRRMVNRYMSDQISRVCGQEIPDTQCGFRMVHRESIPDLLGGADRFDYETEMLIFASRKGFRIASVPITTVYSDEVSSIHPVRDTIRFFKLMQRQKQALASPAALPTP